MNDIRTISVERLAELTTQENPDVIDVRTPAEYREVHIPAARNVPLDALDPQELLAGRRGETSAPLYVICRSGSRATKACEKLTASGYADVVNVEGGTEAWVKAGLPVRRGKKTMSLERQVRIAAGSLVLIGALLALFIHPLFAAIPAFVGGGLIFAGITDSCAMGMLIARMPWNQGSDEATCCTVN